MSNLIISGTTPGSCGCCGAGSGLECDPIQVEMGSLEEAEALQASLVDCYVYSQYDTVNGTAAGPEETPCVPFDAHPTNGSFITVRTDSMVTASTAQSATGDCATAVAISFFLKCKVLAGTTVTISATLAADGDGDNSCVVTGSCGDTDLVDDDGVGSASADVSFVAEVDCCLSFSAQAFSNGGDGEGSSASMDISIAFSIPAVFKLIEISYSTPSPGVLTC